MEPIRHARPGADAVGVSRCACMPSRVSCAQLIVALMAYVIAKIFSLVFACVLDSLFVCCCRDKADYQAKYMPNRLRTAFGFDKKKKKKKGKKGQGQEEAGEDKDKVDDGKWATAVS